MHAALGLAFCLALIVGAALNPAARHAVSVALLFGLLMWLAISAYGRVVFFLARRRNAR